MRTLVFSDVHLAVAEGGRERREIFIAFLRSIKDLLLPALYRMSRAGSREKIFLPSSLQKSLQKYYEGEKVFFEDLLQREVPWVSSLPAGGSDSEEKKE